MASQNWDWVFHTLGWTLAGLGLLLVLWAVFYDRSRGRKRCPKCWYSMEGAIAGEDGAVTCPECGKRTLSPRKLTKTRRRKRWVALSLVLFLGSHFVWATPRIRSDGWPGAVPTTLMIAGFGWIAPERTEYVDGQWVQRAMFYSQRSELVWSFAEDRVQTNTLWQWQRNWLESKTIRHMHARYTGYKSGWGDVAYFLFDEQEPRNEHLKRLLSEVIELEVVTRGKWPAGLPLRATLSLNQAAYSHENVRIGFAPRDERVEPFVVVHQMHGSTYVETAETGELDKRQGDGFQIELPRLPPGLDGIACDVTIEGDEWSEGSWAPIRKVEYTIPVRTTDSAHEIITPAPDRSTALAVSESDPPHLSTNGNSRMQLQWDPKIRQLHESGSTIGARIEVIGDGIVYFTTEKWWEVHEYDGWVLLRAYSDNFWLQPTQSGSEIDLTQIEIWVVKIVGAPDVALRNFDCDTYWNGEVVFPATFGDTQRREMQDFKSDPNAGPHPDAFVRYGP